MTSNGRNNPLDGLPTYNIPRSGSTKSDPFSLELVANSYMCTTAETNFMALPNNYTFEIRAWDCVAVVNGKISHTPGVLKAILYDFRGHNILEIRKVSHLIKTSRPPVSVYRRAQELMRESAFHKFDVHQGDRRIGQIIYGTREATETYLRIVRADNNTQLVVRSVAMGEFSVFRDESSPSPLCNIKSDPFELEENSSDDFRANIEFYPEADITIEEEKLCTGAAFAYKICEVQSSSYHLRDEEDNANLQNETAPSCVFV